MNLKRNCSLTWNNIQAPFLGGTVLVMLCLLFGNSEMSAQEAVGQDYPESSDRLKVEGRNFSVELKKVHPGIVQKTNSVLELFSNSTDKKFLFGPNGPNPYSWLSPSVVCEETLDFQIECFDYSKAIADTLSYEDVQPGVYWVCVIDLPQEDSGEVDIRFRYNGEVVGKFRISYINDVEVHETGKLIVH